MNSSWRESVTQGGFKERSVKEGEQHHVLQGTNHHTHGLLKTEGARLYCGAENCLTGAEINAIRSV